MRVPESARSQRTRQAFVIECEDESAFDVTIVDPGSLWLFGTKTVRLSISDKLRARFSDDRQADFPR